MALIQDINIDQGANHKETFVIQTLTNQTLPYNATTNPYIALDLTGYTVRMQVRSSYDAGAVALLATNSNGKFTVVPLTGTITLTVLPADTTAILFKGESADYVYDIEVQDGSGNVIRPVQGAFVISREVTR